EVHPVERDRQRLDDRAIGQTDVLRQADALVGPRQRVLGVAAALQTEAGAPLYLALAAVLAVTAAHQRDDRNEIAGFQAFSLAAERDHFACELMPEHVAVLATVCRVFGHVQVAAADAAASDLDHDLIRSRRWIRQALVCERRVQGLEGDGFHGITPCRSPAPA